MEAATTRQRGKEKALPTQEASKLQTAGTIIPGQEMFS